MAFHNHWDTYKACSQPGARLCTACRLCRYLYIGAVDSHCRLPSTHRRTGLPSLYACPQTWSGSCCVSVCGTCSVGDWASGSDSCIPQLQSCWKKALEEIPMNCRDGPKQTARSQTCPMTKERQFEQLRTDCIHASGACMPMV